MFLLHCPHPNKNSLLLTLQEKNKKFKIICIGGSIAIASGEEKQVPKKLENFEFLWRLKNDFFRRSFRLIESLIFYLIGNYSYKIYNKTILESLKNNKIHYWTCDKSENSGEGQLALFFIKNLKKIL